MELTLELPRSVLLALWLADDTGDRAALVRAVQSDDEPHTVQQLSADGAPHDDLGDEPLSALLDACGGTPRDVAPVLPVPGDPGATPASVSSAATDAGEALLVRTPQRCLVAVPAVQRFGSALEPGHLVTWRVGDVPDWRNAVHAQTGTLQDAERELRHGLLQATDALVKLDVARWRPDLAGTVAALRDVEVPTWRLPEGLDGRRANVLASAARLRAIVALATQDDGAAVNLWQADQRSTALREVDRIARRAMAAAASRLTS